jgi:hypothetical protein
MPGYLDHYGAGEERRNKIIFRTIITVLTVAVLGTLFWYLLRNHHQEGAVKNFLTAIRKGDYQGAYKAWGCNRPNACSGYNFDSFLADWGPGAKSSSQPGLDFRPDPALLGITDSESCNNGVLLTVEVNQTRIEKLWVDRKSDAINFAPYPICPHKNPWSIMLHRTVGKLRKPLLK